MGTGLYGIGMAVTVWGTGLSDKRLELYVADCALQYHPM